MLSKYEKLEIIHAHDWLVAPASISSKHYLNVPLVSTIHSTEVGRSRGLHNPDSYLIDGLEWWLTYESKRIIVISNSMKSEVKEHFRLPDEKIDVIPNAIDASKYSIKVDRDEVKRRFGMDPSERIVLFVGRLVPQKGVEYLIAAAPKIIESHPEARIVIVGNGWSKDYLLKIAASTGCQHKITFLGFLKDQDLIELTLSSDVLVIPSVYEPFGIVALEGMAAGVPIVASNTGGLAEVIEHDKTGFLAYKENPDSIAWGVNKILSDPGYASWLAQNAKRKIHEMYSWDTIAKKTIETYRKALGE